MTGNDHVDIINQNIANELRAWSERWKQLSLVSGNSTYKVIAVILNERVEELEKPSPPEVPQSDNYYYNHSINKYL